jgi:hypothetical protein
MKELFVDFRRQQSGHGPIHINGAAVEKVKSFKFLCIQISTISNGSIIFVISLSAR